jgi:hypothetical protein
MLGRELGRMANCCHAGSGERDAGRSECCSSDGSLEVGGCDGRGVALGGREDCPTGGAYEGGSEVPRFGVGVRDGTGVPWVGVTLDLAPPANPGGTVCTDRTPEAPEESPPSGCT